MVTHGSGLARVPNASPGRWLGDTVRYLHRQGAATLPSEHLRSSISIGQKPLGFAINCKRFYCCSCRERIYGNLDHNFKEGTARMST